LTKESEREIGKERERARERVIERERVKARDRGRKHDFFLSLFLVENEEKREKEHGKESEKEGKRKCVSVGEGKKMSEQEN